MTNDETKTGSSHLFRHLSIRHSDIDSNFEFRHSNLLSLEHRDSVAEGLDLLAGEAFWFVGGEAVVFN